MTVTVVRAGPSTTIQDRGRPGLLHLGVPRSGAADQQALELANRLVGNDEGDAGLETTLGGLTFCVDEPTTVAVTGALVDVRVDGRLAGMNSPVYVAARETMQLGLATEGLRTYVAFRGGIACPLVLGSRATDVLTGVGPPPVRDGDMLLIGPPVLNMPGVDVAAVLVRAQEPLLRLSPGPRADRLTPAARLLLLEEVFTVSDACNRIGVRLDGPTLSWADEAEMASEPMVAGAVQVPPHGSPILLLRDHPTTGGYPVVAVLADADLSRAGQLRPGQKLRFSASPESRTTEYE